MEPVLLSLSVEAGVERGGEPVLLSLIVEAGVESGDGDCPQTISNPITGLWLSSRCGRHQIHPTNLVKQTLGSST